MSLHDKILVNTHYTRSVNLERDADSIEVVKAYIPTSRALRTFSQIACTFHTDQAPRAWSLVGPYGSGKSSFSVFLSQLLSSPAEEATKAALQVLYQANKNVAKPYAKFTSNSAGFFKVLITGAPEPMGIRLIRGLVEAAQSFWGTKKGRKPKVLNEMIKASGLKSVTTTQIIDLIKNLQDELGRNDCPGILLIIDELGKFLEYEARHYGANDIYLLQALAEHACSGGEVNLLVFALLHQSFEQYAKGLGESLKNEWSKVQGRFEEVPFLESSEQVLRIVSAAFSPQLTKNEGYAVSISVDRIIAVLKKIDALPGSLTATEATALFSSCYPLHPVSAILLPVLCQKVAQNERTLFSYLGSHEEYGLQDMLKRLQTVGDFVLPHHVFDYFIANQTAVMNDHQTHRRWAEVVTAIESLGDAPDEQISLLKTIGILNIIGGKGGFKASKELLEVCLPAKTTFTKASKALKEKSVITYRRYNSEFRVWQGSDFDVEAALQDELNNLGNFSLAEELNKAQSLLPIVARKYTIKNGSLRYFVPTFIDAKNYKGTKPKDELPRIVFYLAAAKDDEKLFYEEIISYFSELDLVVLCLSGMQLRDAVAETQALNRVQINRLELRSDPVAKREFEDRLTAAEHSEAVLLQALVDTPEINVWFHRGIKQVVNTKRALQEVMSSVLEEVYFHAPALHNELINRDRPSSQANAARNKLLYAMLNHEKEPDLGIDKFPPEKAIYRSLLLATGLHKQSDNGEWRFVAPEIDESKLTPRERAANTAPVWDRINQFLDSTEKEAKSFAELNRELMAPPYGLKAGVLPILYIAAYAMYQGELALYESRRYKPYFTEDMLERFVKRPDEFEFQRFRIEGLKASIFDQYSQVIHGDTKKRTVLELARPLATFMDRLPEYTQKTRRGIGPVAQSVRSAFNLAKSPERLLFQEIPQALGLDNVALEESDAGIENLANDLTATLRELRGAYESLLDKQRHLLAQAFNINAQLNLNELRKVLAGKCHGLENYTVDTQGLRAFIMRLTKSSGEDVEWFEKILMFLGHKPSQKWHDSDQDIAEHRLNDFSRRVIDLEALSIYEQRRATQIDGDFDVYLLRSVKKGGDFKDEVVAVDKQSAKYIADAKEAISVALRTLGDKELKLAVLAETVDEFLTAYKSEQATGNPQSSNTPGMPKPKRKPKLVKGG
jgi:hypothetical protein